MHADELLRAVTEFALAVQRARSVPQILTLAGASLEALGFEVVVVAATQGARVALRYRTQKASAQTLEVLRRLEGVTSTDDVPAQVARCLGPHELDLPATGAHQHAMALPLNAGERGWGAIILLHQALQSDHRAMLSLFALQLGAAIDRADHLERLNRRTAELELVHQLAASGPQADLRALCRGALELVCRSTSSDAAMLHRYDQAQGVFERVGEPFGISGTVSAPLHRYRLPHDSPWVRAGPVQVPSAALVPEVVAAGFNTVAFIPLAREGATIGALALGRCAATDYVDGDLRLAEILGLQMTAVLERTRLADETNRLYADLKRSYDQLARTQAELVRHERLAALGELAAVMAHEVRNPLGVIFNSLTALKRLLKPTGDADMLLNMVGEEADRLNRIVTDLLDFVRPFDLIKKPIDIEPVVLSAVDAAAQALASANVRVATELPADLEPFPADPHLLKQALVNLVVNAVQAMPRGGVVLVRVLLEPRPAGAWLRIEVRDEGLGLSQRAAEKIFQPFFTTKATGTGLGLAVVKRIVDGHQGEISAAANEGHGTTFTLCLPPAEGEARVPPPAPPARGE